MKSAIAAAFMLVISALIPASASASGSESLLSDTVRTETAPAVRLSMPLALTARDFITKIYGFIDPRCTQAQTVEAARRIASVIPEADEFGLWLNADNGYAVSYYGMQPDVEAMAQFDGNQVSNYGFFFLFPYSPGEREKANSRQTEFCSSLLQELHDLGLSIRHDTGSDAIFEAIGDFAGNSVDIRLIEEFIAPDGENTADAMSAAVASASADKEGRFIVVLNVEPGAFSAADDLAAIE